MGEDFFFFMPRNQLTKDEIKTHILKLKNQLNCENINWSSDPKSVANRYLNHVLDKIEEYAR
jgi:hypothetical protein